MLPLNSKDINEFVEKWNRLFPIDRWYRKKYNIPFNSSIHKSICLADMYFEFCEFIKYNDIKNKEEEFEEDKYIRGKGNFMKSKLSSNDIDKLFDELDIDEID